MQQGAGPGPYRGRLRADSTFFLELQFCHEHGLPHSTFLRWDPVDRAKALAFAIEKSLRCVMCGTAGWEWEADRFAYEPVEARCQGCYAKETAAEFAGRNPGVSIELLPTHGREAAVRQLRDERAREKRAKR